LQKEVEIDIRWTAFPLHPETPEEGLAIEELFAGRLDLEAVMNRLRQAAREAGVPFGDRKMTYNSRLAQELTKWAESKGKGREIHEVIFRAYFVQGLNIGLIPRLAELAELIGLPGDEAREVLQKRSFKEAVDSDWIRSHQLGIQAVPTFILGRNILVGAQPYEKLKKFVDQAKLEGLDDRFQ
jgi:predicted DsbA family dithiol-disulfide isomerase